jgi:hypothetical protein
MYVTEQTSKIDGRTIKKPLEEWLRMGPELDRSKR